MSERDRNRERMPQVATWVDGLRELFGPVTVEYASEGGLTLGKPGPVGVIASQTCAPLTDVEIAALLAAYAKRQATR